MTAICFAQLGLYRISPKYETWRKAKLHDEAINILTTLTT